MRVGVPKEVKIHEYRVGLVPASVRELVRNGHEALVEAGAGAAIGFTDSAYVAAGASVVPDAASVFEQADMVVKVKEPTRTAPAAATVAVMKPVSRRRGFGRLNSTNFLAAMSVKKCLANQLLEAARTL